MRRTTAAWAFTLGLAGVCSAQPSVGAKYEVTAGVRWVGPFTVSSQSANETTASSGPRPLFNSTTTLGGSIGATAGWGVRLSRAIRAEMAAAYSRAQLSSQVSGDAEQVAATTVGTPLTQIAVEGGVLVQRTKWQARRWQPFATAGVGYIREMYTGRTLIESGSALYIGGGLYYVRASSRTRPGRFRATGLRVDLRGYMRRGGVALASKVHTTPELMATLFARF